MPAIRFLLFSLLALTLLLAATFGGLLLASLPDQDGQIELAGLNAEVTVTADQLAVPNISADNRYDAFRSLGFLHARDRLFQMELMRRNSAGRLAELFGQVAVAHDRKQRGYQFSKAAEQAVADLPDEQRRVLKAYVAGVNAYIDQAKVLPPEFLLLRHKPEPWCEQDSMLVVLGMFQVLNGQEQDERMVSVMEKALPAELVHFLTPDTDPFAGPLLGGGPRRFSDAVPVKAFAALDDANRQIAFNAVDADSVVAGSNQWAVGASKAADGRAMIANDMHLGLGVPNIWYRAELHYQTSHLFGVTLPGVPAVIAGGNDQVAWGFTNVTGDFLDLIRLEINPDNPQQYLTPRGWLPFQQYREVIRVKDGENVEFELRETIWGPVSEQALLGQAVAVKWLALERFALDLGLLAMDGAQNVEQAMAVMNRSGAPPQNVVLADSQGHIAWTYMGRFPHRQGFDGLVSRSWAAGELGWQGYIPADDLPRVTDPAQGFIVTANNRTVGSDYPYVIGHNWALGYRAYRVAELLRSGDKLDERDLLAIQLDTRAAVYDFYRDLALVELSEQAEQDAELQEIESALQAWDGQMAKDSVGAVFLQEFRQNLAVEVFGKIVAACQTVEPQFQYAWREMETPLRLLLTQRPAGVLSAHYRDDWRQLLMDTLRRTAQALHARYPEKSLTQMTWGKVHAVSVQHPFGNLSPLLAKLLNMPVFAADGCASVCVKVMAQNHGASERMVLSPAHPEAALFHMPAGQSGHFLSPHYRDQQNLWQQGEASAMRSNEVVHSLLFKPKAAVGE